MKLYSLVMWLVRYPMMMRNMKNYYVPLTILMFAGPQETNCVDRNFVEIPAEHLNLNIEEYNGKSLGEKSCFEDTHFEFDSNWASIIDKASTGLIDAKSRIRNDIEKFLFA